MSTIGSKQISQNQLRLSMPQEDLKKVRRYERGNEKRKSRKNRYYNAQKIKEQKGKQRSAKHYTENWRSRNTNPIKYRGWTHVLRKGIQFLLHMCYS